MKQQDQLLTANDASKVLNLSPDGVRRLTRIGTLLPAQTTRGGIKLYRLSDVIALSKEREKQRRRAIRRIAAIDSKTIGHLSKDPIKERFEVAKKILEKTRL